MRLLSSLLVGTAACVALSTASLPASAGKAGCRQNALDALQAQAPQGFAIYRQISEKAFFNGWLDCEDAMFSLPTAVHETVHHITADADAYPLLDGTSLPRPHEASSFVKPMTISGKFQKSDFVTTYLRPGSASSASDFVYLLDEMNAYTHDLNTSVALRNLRREDEDLGARDGLASLMAFVAVYLEYAERSEPKTWGGLTSPRIAKTVTALWDQAEKTMTSACGIPGFGVEDKPLIRQSCGSGPQNALAKIIGRAPVCPVKCLKATQEAARRVGE